MANFFGFHEKHRPVALVFVTIIYWERKGYSYFILLTVTLDGSEGQLP